jgi:hypothetical protein
MFVKPLPTVHGRIRRKVGVFVIPRNVLVSMAMIKVSVKWTLCACLPLFFVCLRYFLLFDRVFWFTDGVKSSSLLFAYFYGMRNHKLSYVCASEDKACGVCLRHCRCFFFFLKRILKTSVSLEQGCQIWIVIMRNWYFRVKGGGAPYFKRLRYLMFYFKSSTLLRIGWGTALKAGRLRVRFPME